MISEFLNHVRFSSDISLKFEETLFFAILTYFFCKFSICTKNFYIRTIKHLNTKFNSNRKIYKIPRPTYLFSILILFTTCILSLLFCIYPLPVLAEIKQVKMSGVYYLSTRFAFVFHSSKKTKTWPLKIVHKLKPHLRASNAIRYRYLCKI